MHIDAQLTKDAIERSMFYTNKRNVRCTYMLSDHESLVLHTGHAENR